MIVEPIILLHGVEGDVHFDEALPLKTVIDVTNLLGRWVTVRKGSVILELDGRTVIYDKIGLTPEGHWVCRLRVDPATVYEQS